jgi:hypothetical protein
MVTRVLALDPSPARPLRHALSARRLAGPRVRRFGARPDPGAGRVVLDWATIGASSVRLDGLRVAARGTLAVAATRAARHTLIAAGPLGSDARTLDVSPLVAPPVVRISPRPPTIAEFTLTHARSGQPYALRWHAVDAAHVSLDGHAVGASGVLPLPSPVADHTYTIVARNADGVTRASVDVQVR